MIQDLYQRAMKFAGEKHSSQKVTGSTANYLLHISNVTMEVIMAFKEGESFDFPFAIQVAILHDTIEDTETTVDELNTLFGEKVTKAVLALTKNESLLTSEDKMKDTLRRINLLEKEVGLVKLADRITNLQPPPSNWTEEKKHYYLKESQMILEALKNKNSYLEKRLGSKIEEYAQYL